MKYHKLHLLILIGILAIWGCKDEPELPNTLETLMTDSDLSRFVEAIEYGDTELVFSGSSIITVLAPTNAAVDSFLARGGYDDITDVPKEVMTATVLYHLQQGTVMEADLLPGYYLTPSSFAPANNLLTILIDELGGDLAFNNEAQIIDADISVFNGIIHKTNAMLALPTVMDMLEDNRQFDILVEAIKRSGLRSQFSGNSTVTLFAPPDAAWENYFDIKPGILSINDLTDEELKEIVLTHTLSGNNRFSDFANLSNQPFDNLNNGQINIGRPFEIVMVNDTVATLLMDVQATNGVIHFVDKIIEP